MQFVLIIAAESPAIMNVIFMLTGFTDEMCMTIACDIPCSPSVWYTHRNGSGYVYAGASDGGWNGNWHRLTVRQLQQNRKRAGHRTEDRQEMGETETKFIPNVTLT